MAVRPKASGKSNLARTTLVKSRRPCEKACPSMAHDAERRASAASESCSPFSPPSSCGVKSIRPLPTLDGKEPARPAGLAALAVDDHDRVARDRRRILLQVSPEQRRAAEPVEQAAHPALGEVAALHHRLVPAHHLQRLLLEAYEIQREDACERREALSRP